MRLIVPPRMHTIHHAAVRAHTNSNWSSGLTLWDRVDGTLHLDVAQEEITIGVPAYPCPVTAPALLRLPFQAAPPTWASAPVSSGPADAR